MSSDEYDKLSEKMDAMLSAQSETHAQMVLVKHRVEGHSKTLYGNGQPGLVKRIDRMEATQIAQAESQEKQSRLLRWQVGLAVTILIGVAAIIF